MVRRLLITRPAAQAQVWVTALRQQGVAAVSLPLIDILEFPEAEPAIWQSLTQLSQHTLVVFVSTHAVAHFFSRAVLSRVVWPATSLAGSTGPATTSALRAAGVPSECIVQPSAGQAWESESLWQALQLRLGPDWSGRSVLVVRGDTGRDWLADTLRQAGAQVEFLQVYRRSAPVFDPEQQASLLRALRSPQDHAWVLTSAQSVQHLVDLARQAGHTLQGSTAWVSHARVAEAAKAAGFTHVEMTGPGLQGLVDALRPKQAQP